MMAPEVMALRGGGKFYRRLSDWTCFPFAKQFIMSGKDMCGFMRGFTGGADE